MRRALMAAAFLVASGSALPSTYAGQVFVTGHDPDFHAQFGPNEPGAQHIIQDALTFARNGNSAPILLIESNLNNLALGDHLDSETGLVDSGYSAGTTAGKHYVKVSATQFSALTITELEQFSAIFVPSDHGGTLTEADLVALNARASDIITYLNAGGGLVALAEDGNHSGGSSAKLFGFLPFLLSSTAFAEAENGNTLTPFGTSLGLSVADINGNFSHNIFTATGGMHTVDTDANGDILSLGFQGQITLGGVTPEPGTVAGAVTALALALGCAWRRRRSGRTHAAA